MVTQPEAKAARLSDPFAALQDLLTATAHLKCRSGHALVVSDARENARRVLQDHYSRPSPDAPGSKAPALNPTAEVVVGELDRQKWRDELAEWLYDHIKEVPGETCGQRRRRARELADERYRLPTPESKPSDVDHIRHTSDMVGKDGACGTGVAESKPSVSAMEAARDFLQREIGFNYEFDHSKRAIQNRIAANFATLLTKRDEQVREWAAGVAGTEHLKWGGTTDALNLIRNTSTLIAAAVRSGSLPNA